MQRVYQLNRCILLSVYSRRCLDVNSQQVLNSARSWYIEDRHGVDSKNGRHETRFAIGRCSIFGILSLPNVLGRQIYKNQKSQPRTLGH